MVFNKEELINDFFKMIRNFDGTRIDILEIRKYFGLISEIRNITPPTVEFMTVLKAYRPILFHEFRKSLVPSTAMWFLANVNMAVGDALVSLGITDVEHLQRLVKGE
ncbi:hypothetical protein [Paenibacillus alginolyticus]|uniref:hypothetical protein n=1 Tax=Paenibacillus alginolyticus TaxID=59839 RepID=UPI001564250C|nr:hypothetical protein [Paenibacillus frigoriresistens]